MQDVTNPVSLPALIIGICWIFFLSLTLHNISFFTRWVQTDHPQPSSTCQNFPGISIYFPRCQSILILTRTTDHRRWVTMVNCRWKLQINLKFTMTKLHLNYSTSRVPNIIFILRDTMYEGCPESVQTLKIARHCVDLAGRGKCYPLVMSLTNCVAKTALLYLA
jgi:hypothetical protein